MGYFNNKDLFDILNSYQGIFNCFGEIDSSFLLLAEEYQLKVAKRLEVEITSHKLCSTLNIYRKKIISYPMKRCIRSSSSSSSVEVIYDERSKTLILPPTWSHKDRPSTKAKLIYIHYK